jgi:Asp-tRNA(Asn)/Glu-tRNA(Gln) amidotransferase A subunit family amidase
MTTTTAQLAYMSLADVAKRIASRELSPREVTLATIDRITAVEPKLHSYYTILAADALVAARIV